jgi:copper chaperone CopZ
MKVDGMSCGHCVARVQDAVKVLPGVRSFEVTIGEVEVWTDPGRLTPSELGEAIAAAGFQPYIADPDPASPAG